MRVSREDMRSASPNMPIDITGAGQTPGPRKKKKKSKASAMGTWEMVEMVSIFDRTDYDGKRTEYERPNARKDAILERAIDAIQAKFGIQRSKDQLRKRWSDLKLREQEKLDRLRRIILKRTKKKKKKKKPGHDALVTAAEGKETVSSTEEGKSASMPASEAAPLFDVDLTQPNTPLRCWTQIPCHLQLLHKNGKIAILSGTDEGEETVEVIIQAEEINGYQEEEVAKEVEQTEPAKVTLNGEQEENMEVSPSDITLKESPKEDGQAELSEINETTPVSEEKVESPEQSNESQSNEVGFKKVFKFVGFKFTVKKDKTEKSEPVQLLNVKKDEAELNGTTSQEEHIDAATESNTETQEESKDDVQKAESPDEDPQVTESAVEVPEEAQTEELPDKEKKKEPEVEKDKKSPESPTNTVVTETSSPFKRFFTQGWAGLRKRTSFKKSKEEDPQEVEKHIKCEEQEKTEAPEPLKEESETAKVTAEEQPVVLEPVVLEESSKPASEEPKSPNEEGSHISSEETKAEKSPSDQPEDQKAEETLKANECIEQVAGEKESLPEIVTSASSAETAETDTLDIKAIDQITEATSPPSVEVSNESQPEVAPETEVPAGDQTELHSSTESSDLEKGQETITTEAELLSSQEKVKAQGSPLKKLFSSSGLRKLSGKKSKGKKDDDAKADVTAEPAPASSESPEAVEVDNEDSSPSSPDESAENSPTEKPVEEESQAVDLEGEGATSDGERKKDGITPWASFKKLVTPKRRPKRPSESDKEDEVDKAKTSTLSSTDSGGSVENQEEVKETGDEQKLEKSTDENKKKADSSVSWDALICVGSSKKRARKTSDSDEEEIQKSQEECKKNDAETVQTKEPESESPITNSQEQQVQESPSPDQASSPQEGDGVSTWQSFKRLVTPRRKSKTKAEEKPEDAAALSNPEQSTSEGEGSKEESWVSFKKLIPGRKKKRSDAKQEQAPPTAGQPLQESAEDDSDEPAVVPLAEFDAAELEKLNAQKSANVSDEQKESLEKPSDELIHAVTVTLIEGERAVTSLEERGPSWISAKVSETIEHAKEVEETTEKIKTEITVEETVVFSTVSQVMSETQSTLINEVELTSEALTALEEAIETSCTEETTEMLSAVSQLGESVMSTEQATPVPEDDASMQILQEQKPLTDNILHAVAESAKLAVDVISPENIIVSANVEDALHETNTEQSSTTLTTDIFEKLVEEHKHSFNVVQEHIEDIIISVTEKVTECIPISFNETVQVKSEEKVSESTVEETNTVDGDESVSEKPSESVYLSANDQDTEGAPISAEEKTDKPVSYETLEDLQHSAEAQMIEENIDNDDTKVILEEQTTEVEVPTTVEPVAFELEAKESIIVSSEVQEAANPAADVKHVEKPAEIESEVKNEDGAVVTTELTAEEGAPVADEVKAERSSLVATQKQAEESILVATDMQAKEEVPVPLEVQAKDDDLVLPVVRAEEGFPVPSEAHDEEGAPVSLEVQAEESDIMPLELQAKEKSPLQPEVQTEDCTPVLAEVKAEEINAIPLEVQTEEGVPLIVEVKAEESDDVPSEVQTEEGAPVLTEVKAQESEAVSCEVQAEESGPVSSEVQVEEAAPLPSEEQVKEAVPVPSKVQAEEVSLPSEVQVEQAAPLTSEVQAEETAPVPPEVQVEEAAPVPSEVQVEQASPFTCEVQAEQTASVPPEVQVEEAASVPSAMQAEKTAPLPSEEQAEDAALPSEVQVVQDVPLASEGQAEETAPVPPEAQVEDAAPMQFKVQTEEATSVLPEVKAEETTPMPTEAQTAGDVTLTAEIQAEVLTQIQAEENLTVLIEPHGEGVPVMTEVQAGGDTKVTNEVQAEEGAPVPTEVQTAQYSAVTEVQAEDCVLVTAQVAAEFVPVSAEVKAQSVSSLSSEKHTEKAARVSPEKEAGEVVAVSTVEESAHAGVEGQANEAISFSDNVDNEDSTSELVKELAEEKVVVEEQVKIEESTEKNVLVSAEKQDNEDVSTLSDAPAKEDVSSSAEVQIELPEKAQKQVEEVVTTSYEDKAEKDVESDQPQSRECVLQKGEQIEECSLAGAMEKVITVVDDQLDNTEPVTVKDTQTPDEETKVSEVVTADQHEDKGDSGALNNEEIITTDIPEFETSEARNASEPVAAAAVEEKMLAETVKPIETSSDCIQLIEHHEEKPAELQTLVASVSKKAAAIVDAAIEAATNFLVVDASSQSETYEDTTLTEEKHQPKDTTVETNITQSSSTTIEHITIETTVETVTEKECVSTERPKQDDEFVSQVQEPVQEPITVLSTSAQTKGNETDDESKPSTQECAYIPSTNLVDGESAGTTPNVGEESKLSSLSLQEDIHKTSVQTDSSATDTQEKAQPVES